MNHLAKFLLLVVSFFALQSKAQDKTPAFVSDSLDAYVQRAMQYWQVPGIAVCIIKDGKVVVMKGWGVKELGTNNTVDENTLFMIGSNTKAFTATALATLHYEHKLSLDDKVTKWIPTFKLDNKAAGEQAIIRDLLCHRIGFRTFQGDFTYWTSNLTRAEVIEKMSHIHATYPFRTTWGYTNAAFLTAGEIIPKVTGKPWEVFIKERIFIPLGMNNTLALSKDVPLAANKATPYTMDGDKLVKIPYCLIDNLASAGSISSSVHDLSKWVMMQLNNGVFEGKQIIPAAAIAELRKPHSIMDSVDNYLNTAHFALYGLGFELTDYEGKKIVSHTGGVNGFVTSVTMIPEENLGIVILTNTDYNEAYQSIKWEILDAYLHLPYRDYNSAYFKKFSNNFNEQLEEAKKLEDSVALHPKTSLPLASYTGKYFNQVYGNMEVVLVSGELRMKFSHHPQMYASLQPLGANRFYAVFSDPEFTRAVFPFTVSNGKVRSVTVKVADFIEYNPYEFVRLQ